MLLTSMLKGCTKLTGKNKLHLSLINIRTDVTLVLPFSEKRKHELFIELLTLRLTKMEQLYFQF